ncbi:Gp1ba [Symbiodinium natans]|uniref:Gp1ba protein n=1 Tax=Symbiodinium natans TaxID=878477 RepID=A0A812SN40_9DINO|nr:Gp1ba [Symbiodinium natans]
MDARPFDEVAGFKARHQPCVWCGGGSCHSNNDNACEPYDFVMNGAGDVFVSQRHTGKSLAALLFQVKLSTTPMLRTPTWWLSARCAPRSTE